MEQEIIVSTRRGRTRVAVLEKRIPVELYLEDNKESRLVGNIFKGKVENVLPGIEAAFVNIGEERNAFLYVADVLAQGDREPGKGKTVKDLLQVGQDVLVQVVKDPIGSKGPRVSMEINLPGHFIVLMPQANYVGISKRIEEEEERSRLREIINRLRPERMGIILRTAARGQFEDTLEADLKTLLELWQEVKQQYREDAAPALIYRESALLPRVIRDLFNDRVQRFVVDSRAAYVKTLGIVEAIDPDKKRRVFWDNSSNVFSTYNINPELEKALQAKVWLRCGGYLVFDQTEALTVIDVNTGRYTGKSNLESTVFKTNSEAAVEIVRQLRLRNIGGIIIIDFIDMTKENNRRRVLDILSGEIQKDRQRSFLMGITKLGLVELTRKKVYPSLAEVLLDDCPQCSGTGKVRGTK